MNVTLEDIDRYTQHEPLSTQRKMEPPIIDVFCSAERVALYDRDIWVISNQENIVLGLHLKNARKESKRKQASPALLALTNCSVWTY